MAQPVQQPQVVYLVERRPPPTPEPPAPIDQIRKVAGYVLATLGLIILTGAAIALVGYVTATLTVSMHTLHSVFIMGIACTVGGFHLAKGGTATPYAEISSGPFSVTI
ncbi:MAG: hypothetical protein K1X28_00960 [Parachlamydiales bacterium]|nr:hypothetical protein [Parachlamydiales bacterium]